LFIFKCSQDSHVILERFSFASNFRAEIFQAVLFFKIMERASKKLKSKAEINQALLTHFSLLALVLKVPVRVYVELN
jgi:hypothetical protein